MILKNVFAFLFSHIASILKVKFTGKITITLNCKDGNVGTFEIQTGEQFTTKDI